MPKTTRIKSIEELKTKSQENGLEVFICLNFGLRSSKYIQWLEKQAKFYVWNLIDDSSALLTEDELLNENLTNIGQAMRTGALFIG